MNVESYHYDATKDLIHLPGTLWGPLGEQRLRFVFDPGAFRTIIDISLMDSLGYQATSTSRKIGTSSAIGKEWGYTTVVQKLSILSFTLLHVEVACFDLPEDLGVDALLGLDLLEKFQVTLRHHERWIEFQRLG